MKKWLTKLRISAALDAGKPLPESLRQQIASDPELERFVHRTQFLDSRLRAPKLADPDLHNDIMRAVRASRRTQSRPSPSFYWLLASGAGAAIAIVCLFITRPRNAPPANVSMDAPITVLEMSEQMPAAMPDAVMAPLSNEWVRVDHDVRKTTEILAASLPFPIQ